jgi:two-component sensor histidine kinase
MINAGSLRKKPVLGYGFAVLAFSLTLALRFWLSADLAGYPFVIFLPTILVVAVVAGAGPGALSGILSYLAAVYFFVPPEHSLFLTKRTDIVGAGFFVFVIVVKLVLIDMLNRKIDELDAANLDRQRLVDYQKTLFAELQHRVANNLAFVSSLLSLQKRELEKDSVAAKVLDLAGLRVMAMSRIHRTLHDQASLDQPLPIFLKQLTLDVLKSAGAEAAIVEAYGDEIRLDLDRLTTLALLVSELVTNSAKHVLLKGLGDKIALHVERLDGTKVRVEISDNGPGLPPSVQQPTKGDRLGQAIIKGLISQLHGEYEALNHNGAVAIITFPLVTPKSQGH